eukprot:TRINITY_DN2847_c0_g1_i2.p1 TRINITY_DN2847_c0_g1~~TRINITY_DN2847_c0_g1_i2.p1  ORF type:complete len:505 (-),score=110.17 TRINITY_DN2847_c0_g1_i2:36-1550(-)
MLHKEKNETNEDVIARSYLTKQDGGKFIGWIFLLSCAMAGVQFVYSIQFAIGAPLLNQKFALSNSVIAIIMSTSGAISGFIVQPIVGVYSDTCESKFGRRRPFIVVGTIFCMIGMAFTGFSVQLGQMLGDTTPPPNVVDSPHNHTAGIIIAICSLWIINISVNAMQGPARAIIADLVPSDSQHTANSIVTGVTGLSNIIANVVGAQFLMTDDPYLVLFLIGCGFIVVCVIPTIIVAKEIPYRPLSGSSESKSPIQAFKKIGISFYTMPNVVVRIFIVFFFSWCAYSPFLIFTSNYFAQNVYGGSNLNPSSVIIFKEGVKMAMYALAGFAGVSFLFSMILPSLIKISMRGIYFISQVIATGCFASLWAASVYGPIHPPASSVGITIAFVLTSVVAINFTAFNSIPFALLSESVPSTQVGLYMGVLNSAATVSQVLTNILAGQVIVAKNDDNVAWALCFGACISVVASGSVWILKQPKQHKQHYDTNPLMTDTSPLIQARDYPSSP